MWDSILGLDYGLKFCRFFLQQRIEKTKMGFQFLIPFFILEQVPVTKG